jgi:hypothetical protein
MRGQDQQQNHMFSYLSPEARVRKDHPLRAIRVMVDEVLTQHSRRFDSMYARVGRPSIAPEKLLRAQLPTHDSIRRDDDERRLPEGQMRRSQTQKTFSAMLSLGRAFLRLKTANC